MARACAIAPKPTAANSICDGLSRFAIYGGDSAIESARGWGTAGPQRNSWLFVLQIYALRCCAPCSLAHRRHGRVMRVSMNWRRGSRRFSGIWMR